MRLWPFGRKPKNGKPKKEHYIGEYTEPSFRGGCCMLIVSLTVIVLLWLAYSWALNQPGMNSPNL